jgi:hypothetical protein
MAQATAEGVRLTVDSAAWKAGRVHDALSPVLVELENHGTRPLRISHSQFTLGGPGGFRLQALPPHQVALQNGIAVADPWYGFWPTPWEVRFYRPGLPIWEGPLAYDAAQYRRSGASPALVPDEHVLRHALPEGVLDPHGRVSGYLYFADQPRGTAVTFVATLVDAQTNAVLGDLEIPFTVH